MDAKTRFSTAADTASDEGSGAHIRNLYRAAARAALCFVPGARADDAFMDALGALEEALVSEAARRGVDIVPKLEGLEDSAQIQKEIRRVQKVERDLLSACLSADGVGAALRPMSRDAMMELAVAQRDGQDKGKAVSRLSHSPEWYDWIAAWKEAGAAVDAVERPLIPSDTSSLPGVRTAFNPAEKKEPNDPVERLKRLDALLADQEIEAGDLVIHPGVSLPETGREVPYLLIDIPCRNLQIAVCEHRNQITFVGRKILPPSFWAETGKAALKQDPSIYPVRDSSLWGEKIAAHFDETFLRRVQSVWDGPFIEEGRGAGRAVLNRKYLTQLISWYQEKEGADPLTTSQMVWGKNREGEWVRLDESWIAINVLIAQGSRNSDFSLIHRSLAGFMDEYKLTKYTNPPLTDENLIELIELFQEMEGRDPSATHRKKEENPVWRKGKDGKPYIDDTDSWIAIRFALKYGSRGATSPARSLAEFLDMNNLRKFSKPHPNGLFQREGRTQGETGAPPAPPPAP